MDVENGGEGGGVGGRVGGGRSWDRLREGRRERQGTREEEVDIKYARTDAWSHSSLPFLPVSLFPILVPSKRSPLPVYLLFSRLFLFLFLYVSRDRLYPRIPSPSYYAFLAFASLARASLDRLFFSSSSRNYSFHCCMHTDNV